MREILKQAPGLKKGLNRFRTVNIIGGVGLRFWAWSVLAIDLDYKYFNLPVRVMIGIVVMWKQMLG